ncbi:UdgX family uracil-DNA binding protein [Pacificimonas flava]|uniref:Type-4 uracil-DNA glycosylase n=1 Tax=Pacificimonas flava TaxID=1234595 RepID=M2U2M9_9SPHN|nr:UdgX family uracil-DNA binding protein [Pacificimonas flava]EMD82227.1 hypothetical protein C725_2265 [Pacificimonas flava]MBB5280862.1 DNA polymerase [Pacificimonas flava]
MYCVTLAHHEDFAGWREAARALALAGVRAEGISWQVGDAPQDLFGDEAIPDAQPGAALTVPKPFIGLAQSVICHSDTERFARLYSMLLKLQQNRRALEDKADPLLRRLEELRKAVGRDLHKMRAFVRFREMPEEGVPDGKRYVAWFEPDHHIVRTNAPFFQRRFAAMHWSILTPELCAHWDGRALSFTPGATRADAPDGDPVEETWKTYFASIFNPARVKVKAMTAEMPKKYWKNMPETALVPGLIAGARARELEMVEKSKGKSLKPVEVRGLKRAEEEERRLSPGGNRLAAWEALLEEAKRCTRCPLYKPATQMVFGEGPVDAPLMLIGEQPGDQEDQAGRPFVGPAGQVLDDALDKAGIDRSQTYVTNAVKHFKFEQRGKRRIHSKPGAQEIEACRWWADQERDLIAPKVTVALGATAARSMIGKVVTISKTRGAAIELPGGGEGWVTVHPSYLLRIPDKGKADEELARFIEDLRTVQNRLTALAA